MGIARNGKPLEGNPAFCEACMDAVEETSKEEKELAVIRLVQQARTDALLREIYHDKETEKALADQHREARTPG